MNPSVNANSPLRALARLLTLGALAALAATAASAAGLEESRLFSIYDSCIDGEIGPAMVSTIDCESCARTESKGASQRNPWIGPAVLEGGEEIYSTTDADNLVARYRYEYRNGKLQVSLGLSSNEHGSKLFTSSPIWLPHYEYRATRDDRPTYSQFGQLVHHWADRIETKPRLVVPRTAAGLVLVRNEDTGQPVRDAKGQPLVFDIGAFRACIQSQVEEAYAQASPTEVSQARAGLEESASPKVVAVNGVSADARSEMEKGPRARVAQ